jgi:putative ABC transport system substrate-binding protein
VVFNVGLDPVQYGLVTSINRPGGTFTGVFSLVAELTEKNIGLLGELVPSAKRIALLADTRGADPLAERDASEAVTRLGARLVTLSAATDGEIDAAFTSLARRPVDAMVVATNPFYVTRAKQIATLAAHYRVPSIYARRDYALAGGLVSYGYNVADSYRQMGNYAARILKGEKASDLPVQQPSKFELVINLRTAKAFGLDIPARLLALADEVIE